MKLRRHIALLILSVYALASGGRAVESLVCRCLCHSESHVDGGRCLICLHRHGHVSAASPDRCYVADCDLCRCNHISSQELYTLTQDDDRSPGRQSTVSAWALCAADSYVGALLAPSGTCRYGRWRPPLPRAFRHAPKALRAPPTEA